MTLVYDPADPATRSDPYPLFKRLAAEDPVHWSPPLKSWVLTRYRDVRRAHARPEMSPGRLKPFYESLPAETRSTLSEIIHYLNLWLVFHDPPEHTRLRRLLNQAFAPEAVAALGPGIATIVDLLLDELPADSEIDFIQDFAMPLPALVILDMLAVDRDMLWPMKRWSDDMQVFIGSARGVPDKYERARHGAHEMGAYFRQKIAERRGNLGDDIMSRLITVRGPDGEGLSEDELVACCMLFLFAGHETTTNLIGNATLLLCQHRAEEARLRADPGLIESAVEEFLRFHGPTNASARVVGVEHELEGKVLKRGERVFALVNAANRDPSRFEDPDRFDITRTPNKHLTFGQGIHFCLGAPLARLEAHIAIPKLLARYGTIELAAEAADLDWHDAIIMRGLSSLPLRLKH
ncbi:MAG: cytochrome P450 [Rhodospirillales bacterium]